MALFTNAWEQRKLGDLADIVRGASPRPISKSEMFWVPLFMVIKPIYKKYFLNT